jgi:hypothetical protein
MLTPGFHTYLQFKFVESTHVSFSAAVAMPNVQATRTDCFEKIPAAHP